MQLVLMVLTGLHLLGGVFWAGSTFAVVRSGGAGVEKLFGPQMGAATITVLAGVGLWGILHRAAHGPMEHTLALGALSAIPAPGAQCAMRRKNPMKGHRSAAGLPAITAVST